MKRSQLPTVDENEYRPGPTALTCTFLVELPGIEPELLPGKMHAELLFRYVSFPFSPARYVRFRFRVLTASRVVTDPQGLPVP
jgi:hypothetical protein